MKNENEFNAALGKEFRKIKGVHVYKPCDRFTAGVSDFFVFGYGKTLALECKFIKEYPKTYGSSILQKHPFTGPQLTFLESMAIAGHQAVGLVAVEKEMALYVLPHARIPPEGTWSDRDFRNCAKLQFQWLDAQAIVSVMAQGGFYV